MLSNMVGIKPVRTFPLWSPGRADRPAADAPATRSDEPRLRARPQDAAANADPEAAAAQAQAGTHEGADVSKAYPLLLARPGEYLRIERLLGNDGLARRLATMGLQTGCVVRVAHQHAGQIVVVRGETRLALGAGITKRILVAPVGADEHEGETP